ncbi:unnamed protein product [Brassica rapa]|uniref:Uncharacterized protein n=2 Tax=Brassica TaxID=3705 RepID=A0A8D9D8R0_BRACM|nr:unnamed protein product [Brassica napus]CAF2084277.1 unnamed protein product [Brassica napus]CAG7869397.1 unnamed protein product [Brassica rapa]
MSRVLILNAKRSVMKHMDLRRSLFVRGIDTYLELRHAVAEFVVHVLDLLDLLVSSKRNLQHPQQKIKPWQICYDRNDGGEIQSTVRLPYGSRSETSNPPTPSLPLKIFIPLSVPQLAAEDFFQRTDEEE